MANFGVTTNWALRKLLGTSNASDIDAGFAALADDVDAKLTPSDQGLFASRPVSTGGSPGKIGRTYKSTDGFGGESVARLFRDNGTGWDEIPFAAQQAWQTLSLAGGFQTGTTLYYYKDTLGRVVIRSDIHTAGASGVLPGVTVGTLPVGYRPGTTYNGIVFDWEQSPRAFPITITTGGAISFANSAALGFSAPVTFGSVSFRAEN